MCFATIPGLDPTLALALGCPAVTLYGPAGFGSAASAITALSVPLVTAIVGSGAMGLSPSTVGSPVLVSLLSTNLGVALVVNVPLPSQLGDFLEAFGY